MNEKQWLVNQEDQNQAIFITKTLKLKFSTAARCGGKGMNDSKFVTSPAMMRGNRCPSDGRCVYSGDTSCHDQ